MNCCWQQTISTSRDSWTLSLLVEPSWFAERTLVTLGEHFMLLILTSLETIGPILCVKKQVVPVPRSNMSCVLAPIVVKHKIHIFVYFSNILYSCMLMCMQVYVHYIHWIIGHFKTIVLYTLRLHYGHFFQWSTRYIVFIITIHPPPNHVKLKITFAAGY